MIGVVARAPATRLRQRLISLSILAVTVGCEEQRAHAGQYRTGQSRLKNPRVKRKRPRSLRIGSHYDLMLEDCDTLLSHSSSILFT